MIAATDTISAPATADASRTPLGQRRDDDEASDRSVGILLITLPHPARLVDQVRSLSGPYQRSGRFYRRCGGRVRRSCGRPGPWRNLLERGRRCARCAPDTARTPARSTGVLGVRLHTRCAVGSSRTGWRSSRPTCHCPNHPVCGDVVNDWRPSLTPGRERASYARSARASGVIPGVLSLLLCAVAVAQSAWVSSWLAWGSRFRLPAWLTAGPLRVVAACRGSCRCAFDRVAPGALLVSFQAPAAMTS